MIVSNESEFHVESGVCIVKFSADWCGPCKRMEPTMEKLELEFSPNVTFISVDVDEVPVIAQKYKIRTLPTLLVSRNGTELNRVTGVSLIEPLRKILREAIENPVTGDI